LKDSNNNYSYSPLTISRYDLLLSPKISTRFQSSSNPTTPTNSSEKPAAANPPVSTVVKGTDKKN